MPSRDRREWLSSPLVKNDTPITESSVPSRPPMLAMFCPAVSITKSVPAVSRIAPKKIRMSEKSLMPRRPKLSARGVTRKPAASRGGKRSLAADPVENDACGCAHRQMVVVIGTENRRQH